MHRRIQGSSVCISRCTQRCRIQNKLVQIIIIIIIISRQTATLSGSYLCYTFVSISIISKARKLNSANECRRRFSHRSQVPLRGSSSSVAAL